MQDELADVHARLEKDGADELSNMPATHFIFIPAVLLIGIVIGWILGSRAARDAYAAELKRRDGAERSKRRKISRPRAT